MAAPQFTGFPPETFAFLQELTANNNRLWFEVHRAEYQAFYLEPALALVTALGPELQRVDSSVRFEPRLNGSLFRINRDVRFSADKTPYKAYIDLWFWCGARKAWDTPGFFFRMLPESLIAGAGMHKFTPAQLSAYRASLAGPAGAELMALTEQITASSKYTLGDPDLVRLPRGAAVPVGRETLARRIGLHPMYEGPAPPEAGGAGFVDWCMAVYRDLAPINQWLMGLAG
ncbi:MAG: DUF2461 domain-containing protein [Dehalococcoidia bacterium]|nr:DUF2461 domain-containing protein [Dehalococcoidia bacterium]